jgi:hypothetical protein
MEIDGRAVTIVFARQKRKAPDEKRRDDDSKGRSGDSKGKYLIKVKYILF